MREVWKECAHFSCQIPRRLLARSLHLPFLTSARFNACASATSSSWKLYVRHAMGRIHRNWKSIFLVRTSDFTVKQTRLEHRKLKKQSPVTVDLYYLCWWKEPPSSPPDHTFVGGSAAIARGRHRFKSWWRLGSCSDLPCCTFFNCSLFVRTVALFYYHSIDHQPWYVRLPGWLRYLSRLVC